jgi:hypothetical protein
MMLMIGEEVAGWGLLVAGKTKSLPATNSQQPATSSSNFFELHACSVRFMRIRS